MEGAGRGGAVRRGEAGPARHSGARGRQDLRARPALDDLKEDLRGRPVDLVRAGESYTLHTRPAFGPAIRVALDIPADAKQLTKLEAGVLMAIAMFQPTTRGELTEMFGREISRDLIGALREERLIAAGPRSPKLGAPYAYVTTEKFLLEFGFESLRDLPDLEALKDAGLVDGRTGDGEGSSPIVEQKGSPARVI